MESCANLCVQTQTTTTASTALGDISNPRELFIGDASRLDNPFGGEMDDIRLFRSTLDNNQVAALTQSLQAAMESADKIASSGTSSDTGIKVAEPARDPRPFDKPKLTAHWPLDNQKGITVRDVVGGNNGELRNADPSKAWISGKLGGAIQLDGENDRI